MNPNDYIAIGYLQKTHGVKGGLSIVMQSEVDLSRYESVFLGKSTIEPYFIKNLSGSGTKLFLELEDVDSLEEAKELVGSTLYLPKDDTTLSEITPEQLKGFQVTDLNRGLIGIVSGFTAGLNPLLVIQPPTSHDEIYIPINSPFILEMDLDEKQIEVDLPEAYPGIDDLNDEEE